jgi:two-component system, cell cycle sensor histidine kinase and response regulator CckA
MPGMNAERLKVLVVDDEEGMRALVRRCLEQRFEVVEAASGADALALAERLWPLGLLLTDEAMPEMEGHELARRFRVMDPDLKVLYLTGFADHLFAEKQQMWDLEAYLEKPFTPDGLRQAIAQLVYGRQAL